MLPPGEHVLSHGLVIGTGVVLRGAGRGVTTLRAARNCHCDVVRTRGFEAMTGRQCLSVGPGCPGPAPRHFAVRDLTIDGGYLGGSWKAADVEVHNSEGSGVRLYGRLFELDIEVRNVAEHMLYVEGAGPRGSRGVRSRIRISGRVAGEECVVFRGPGDLLIEEAVVGLCGVLPRPEAERRVAESELFDGRGVDGIIVDGTGGYEGNVDIAYAHVYASFSGFGLRTRGSARLQATHVTSESNLGGVFLSGLTHGAISLLSVRNNARSHPNLAIDPPTPRPGLVISSRRDGPSPGVLVSAFYCFRSRAPGAADGWPCADLRGDQNTVRMHHRNTTHPDTGRARSGDGVWIRGDGNAVDATLWRVRGNGVVIEGNDNVVTLAAREGAEGAAVTRITSGGGGRGNVVRGAVRGWPVAFRAQGPAPNERIELALRLEQGQRAACGTCPDGDTPSRWDFTGLEGKDACRPSCGLKDPAPAQLD